MKIQSPIAHQSFSAAQRKANEEPQDKPTLPQDSVLINKDGGEEPSTGARFLNAAKHGTIGAVKYGFLGGAALGGLGYMASLVTTVGALRTGGFLVGAGIGMVAGGFLGVQEGWGSAA